MYRPIEREYAIGGCWSSTASPTRSATMGWLLEEFRDERVRAAGRSVDGSGEPETHPP